MHIGQVLNRGTSTGPRFRKPTPWITSPLTEPAANAHGHAGQTSAGTSASDLIAGQGVERRGQEVPRFQQRHESSTIELFYDLFFVANLTSFNNNHEIVDAKSKSLYVLPDVCLNSCSSPELCWLLHSSMVYLASNFPLRRSLRGRFLLRSSLQRIFLCHHDWICHGGCSLRHHQC